MSDRTRVELIARLNDDLAREYAAVVQNRTCASVVAGPHRPALRRLLTEHVARELAHVSLLADKIAALDGVLTTAVAPVASVVPEADPVVMLRCLRQAKAEAAERYMARRALAAQVGEHGLAVELDDLVADETRHRDELTQMLRGWRPTTGRRSPDSARDRDGSRPRFASSGVAGQVATYVATPHDDGPEAGGGSGDGVLRS